MPEGRQAGKHFTDSLFDVRGFQCVLGALARVRMGTEDAVGYAAAAANPTASWGGGGWGPDAEPARRLAALATQPGLYFGEPLLGLVALALGCLTGCPLGFAHALCGLPGRPLLLALALGMFDPLHSLREAGYVFAGFAGCGCAVPFRRRKARRPTPRCADRRIVRPGSVCRRPRGGGSRSSARKACATGRVARTRARPGRGTGPA